MFILLLVSFSALVSHLTFDATKSYNDSFGCTITISKFFKKYEKPVAASALRMTRLLKNPLYRCSIHTQKRFSYIQHGIWKPNLQSSLACSPYFHCLAPCRFCGWFLHSSSGKKRHKYGFHSFFHYKYETSTNKISAI